jgi:hypothetical protein
MCYHLFFYLGNGVSLTAAHLNMSFLLMIMGLNGLKNEREATDHGFGRNPLRGRTLDVPQESITLQISGKPLNLLRTHQRRRPPAGPSSESWRQANSSHLAALPSPVARIQIPRQKLWFLLESLNTGLATQTHSIGIALIN